MRNGGGVSIRKVEIESESENEMPAFFLLGKGERASEAKPKLGQKCIGFTRAGQTLQRGLAIGMLAYSLLYNKQIIFTLF